MPGKMNKKTRNVLSGILVGIASLAAIINFADIPAGEVSRFLVSTSIFFLGIVALALLAVSVFKLLGWIKKRLTGEADSTELEELKDLQDLEKLEKSEKSKDQSETGDRE